MQEEVENRTVKLAISTTKLTGRTIIAGIRKYLQHREKVKMKKARDPAVHGKQSVKQLLGQNQGATNVEIDKESIRDFEKLAKKYGVDFAVRKDKSVDPPRFLVFVRSKDADALDAICKEHQARTLWWLPFQKERRMFMPVSLTRPSIICSRLPATDENWDWISG